MLKYYFSTLLNSYVDGFFALDKEFRFVQINQKYAQMMKDFLADFTKVEDYIGKNIWSVFPALEKSEIAIHYQEALQTQKIVHFEIENKYKTIYQHFDVSVYPFVDGILVFFRDITKEKIQYQKLVISEHKFNAFFNSAFDVNIFLDTKHRVVAFNQVADIFTQNAYGKNLVEGQDFTDFSPSPTIKAAFLMVFDRAMQGEKMVCEYCIPYNDYLKVWWRISYMPVYDAQQHIIGVMINSVDISKEKKSEISLRESEKRFRMLADSAPVFIGLMGNDRKFYFLNKKWLDFLGETEQNLINYEWIRLIHEEEREYFTQLYEYHFDRRVSFEIEFRMLRHDGVYRWFLMTNEVRFDDKKNFLGYIASCVDITERKNYEQLVIEQNIRLREIAWLQGHKVRRPLANILGLISLIDEKTLSKENLELFELLKQSAIELDDVIHEVVNKT